MKIRLRLELKIKRVLYSLAERPDTAARWRPFFLMMKLDPMKALETTARTKPLRLSKTDASIFLKVEPIKHNFENKTFDLSRSRRWEC